MSVASSEVWQEGSWINALPYHPVFKNLSDELPNENDTPLLCESRGDIFIWNPSSWSMLTTNLKRLHAQRDESLIYQNLHPTIIPPTQPIRLLPSLSGHHLALIGECYVNVIELRRQRGPWGEFGGGVQETDCRVIPIGQSLIRAHCLTVLQTQWHPEDDKMITILTNDGVLRLFSLIQPSIPQLSLSLSLTLPSQSHSVKLDDEEGHIIAFTLLNNTVFLLQDKMDLQTIPLKEGGQPSSPLPMYPLVEDNYSGNGCGLLVLPTQPPVIVLASENGTILHCVFVSSDNEEETENGDDEGMICVIEKIVLPENELSTFRLISDPSTKDTYYVQSPASIYHVYMPWLHVLEQFSQDVPTFTADPPCTVTQLFHCTEDKFITDALLVSDGTLGEAVIALCNDGSCWTMSSSRHLQPFPMSFIRPDETFSAPEYPLPDEFVEHIRSIFYQAQQEPISPLPKSHKQSVQKDCFDYVQYSIQVLRKRHLIPQVKVRAILTGRVKLLAKKRERQIQEVMSLEEKEEDIDNDSKNLHTQLTISQERCTELLKRVEKVVCLITSTSPILSDAEKTMTRDLQSIHEKLNGLHHLLQKAKAKTILSLGRSEDTNLSLSDGHMDTVLNTIQDDGTSIKESVQFVKQLALTMDMTTVA